MDSELKNIMKKDLTSVNKVTQIPKTISEYNTRFKNTGKAIKVNKGIFKGIINDTDKDGVVNALDCEPNNPKKQGLAHRLFKGARDKLADKIIEHRQTGALKKDIMLKVRKGEIKDIKDVNKSYGYGHKLRGFAVQQVRNKELSAILEKKSFETRKKILIKQQQQKISQKLTGDPNYGSKKKSLKKQINQNNNIIDQIMRT